MRKILLILIFISAGGLLSGININGRVINESDNTPLQDGTVIIIELDDMTVTGTDGLYSFTGLEKGSYSILVIVPGFNEKTVKAELTENLTLDIYMKPQVVEMDAITVTEEREKSISPSGNRITNEELEKIPTGGDPFSVIDLEEGITQEDVITDTSYVPGSGALPMGLYSSRNKASVYGGEGSWNTYYYDYIRIPSSTHAIGFPYPPPVVDLAATEEIEIYKGVAPLNLGPGIGGLFRIIPRSDIPDGFEMTIKPSTIDVNLVYTHRFSSDRGIVVCLKKSISEITVLPVIRLIEDNYYDDSSRSDETNFSNGDMVIHSFLGFNKSILNIDFLGFYDFFNHETENETDHLSMKYKPFFVAGGTKWLFSPGPVFSNSTYLYGSMYRKPGEGIMNISESLVVGPWTIDNEYNYDQRTLTEIITAAFGNTSNIIINTVSSLSFGLSGYFSHMVGYDKYTPLDDTGEDYLEENRNNSVNENLFLLNSFSRYTAESDSIKIIIGAGLSYLPLHKSVRPQLEFELSKAVSEKLSFSYRTGWSPGYINEFQYIEQKLNEAGLGLDTETDYAHPPMSVSSIFKSEWDFNSNFNFSMSPHFVWYYDLFGMEMQTSYLDTITDAESALFLDSDKGYSAGSDICWQIHGDSRFVKFIYSLGFTRYHTNETGWFYSNNDVRHTCKISFVSSPSEKFKYGINFFIYIDRPFTPEIVVENEDGSLSVIKEEYNSARDLVPRFQLDLKVTWLFKKCRSDWSLFFNSTNLLFFLNPVLDGFRDGKEDSIGASTSDFKNRSYKFIENWTDLLQCQFGFSIKF